MGQGISKDQEDAKIREFWIKNISDSDKNGKIKPKEIYDFIIVGAGSAGCVLARELIHCIPNINILVLEAGGPDANTNGLINLPCTLFKTSFQLGTQLSDNDWGYVDQEQKMQSSVNPTK
ncbi:hypothetical protein C2G38_283716 [Gigaspora rosea]|uniref:Uncharacterized protein n=1 Tax=Gigaspora rosea TaxID=44941 RepID=A0A397W8C3_9GLOM|nr:hypothetical protein C2G38_283716 [Gigaspora rosea]